MLTRTLPAIALAALAFTGSAGQAAPVESQDYIGGPGDAAGICAADNPTGLNLGRVCFTASAGNRYRISIVDAAGHAVGHEWKFTNAAGACVGEDPDDPLAACPNVGFDCGTHEVVAPAGAVQLTVLIDGPAFGVQDCLVGGPGDSLGFGTTGTVTRTKL